MWEGSNGLLLTEYFENKKKLPELKNRRSFLEYRGYDTSELDKDIEKTENAIVEFISGLGSQHLKSLIYMSLDIDVEIGYPDKLNRQ